MQSLRAGAPCHHERPFAFRQRGWRCSREEISEGGRSQTGSERVRFASGADSGVGGAGAAASDGGNSSAGRKEGRVEGEKD